MTGTFFLHQFIATKIPDQIAIHDFDGIVKTLDSLRIDYKTVPEDENDFVAESGIAIGKGLKGLCNKNCAHNAIICLGVMHKPRHTDVLNAIPPDTLKYILLSLPGDDRLMLSLICLAEITVRLSEIHHSAYAEGFAKLPHDIQSTAIALAEKLSSRDVYRLISGQGVVESVPSFSRAISPKI